MSITLHPSVDCSTKYHSIGWIQPRGMTGPLCEEPKHVSQSVLTQHTKSEQNEWQVANWRVFFT